MRSHGGVSRSVNGPYLNLASLVKMSYTVMSSPLIDYYDGMMKIILILYVHAICMYMYF